MALESYIEIQLDVPTVLNVLAGTVALSLVPQTGTQVPFDTFTPESTQYVITGPPQTGSATLLPPAATTVPLFYEDGFGNVQTTSVPATTIGFSLPVTYHLTAVTSSGSSDAGLFNLVLTLGLSITGGVNTFGPSVQTTFTQPQTVLNAQQATGGGANPVLANALQSLLLSSFPPITAGAPAGSFGNVSNTGAAVLSSSVIALRMQVALATEGYTQGMWTEFYTGANITNHLSVTSQTGAVQSGHVSAFVASDLMVSMVQQAIYAALAAHANKFQLQGGVAVNWAPTSAAGAHLDASFVGYAVPGAPAPNIQVNVTAETDVSLAANPSDTLVTHSHFDWSANLGEEILAVLVGGLGAMLTGAEFTGGLGAIPGLIIGVVGTIVAIAVYTPNLSAPNCSQSGSDETCTQTISIPPDPITNQPTLQFLSIAGAPDGMVMFSALNIGPVKIFLSLRNFLQSIRFNFANGLRSLGTAVINPAYISTKTP